MVRQASIAKHYSVSLNPRTNEAEKAAVGIMDELIGRGFTQKQIILDAILRAGGVDPAALPDSSLTASGVEALLERFADHILGEIRKGGVVLEPSEPSPQTDGKSSPFAKRLAQSYASRKVDNE